jgi:hypothetical protein
VGVRSTRLGMEQPELAVSGVRSDGAGPALAATVEFKCPNSKGALELWDESSAN